MNKCHVCGKSFATQNDLMQHKTAKRHGRKHRPQARRKATPTGKADNCPVTAALLNERAERSIALGYQKQKWISFCEAMLAMGFNVSLYEARKTVSKYITVESGARYFKVRFSNHRPIRAREEANDCDFFVGVSNLTTTTTDQAIAAVREYFGGVRAA